MITSNVGTSCTRSLASVQSAGGGHWKHCTRWMVLCTATSSWNTGDSEVREMVSFPRIPALHTSKEQLADSKFSFSLV